MKNRRQSLGKWGEEKAAEYLLEAGFQILDRNARTPFGEIDLIARQELDDSQEIVMVEVKTRSSSRFGFPEEAVSRQKREHLKNSAEAYMVQHPELGVHWRVDVIAIQKPANEVEPEIQHFVNAVN